MPGILDLAGAAPLAEYQSRNAPPATALPAVAATARRTMDPSNNAALLGSGGSGGFLGAQVNRLTMDFIGRNVSADQDLWGDGRRMRARGRDLGYNSPFGRKFLAMISQNVIGPAGILMQAKVVNANGKQTSETKRINQRIEEEWKRWCKRGRCTADGKYSFVALQHLAIKNCAREGENITKDVYGRQFNQVGYALQLLDNDQLDDTMMQQYNNGNQVRMGVEVDEYGRAAAYHLWDGHPNDTVASSRTRKRIPSEVINYTAMFERPGQSRGYTWMAAAIAPMNQLNRYEEAVIVAARTSAAKFFAIEKKSAEGFDLDADDLDEQEEASNTFSADAGEGWRLDENETLNYIDPRFPSPNHKQFMQAMLRSIATGLLVDYPTLANDLEGVNFSSIRAGMLDTRDCYRIIQGWFIETFCEPIFSKWLRMALLTVLTDINLNDAQREMISWKPRGWDWVDPLKDAQAIVLKLRAGLTTYADALGTLGLDFEETMTERAMEQAFIEQLGLELDTDVTGDLGSETDDGESDPKGADSATKQPKSETKPKKTRVMSLEIDPKERGERIMKAREIWQEIRAKAA